MQNSEYDSKTLKMFWKKLWCKQRSNQQNQAVTERSYYALVKELNEKRLGSKDIQKSWEAKKEATSEWME